MTTFTVVIDLALAVGAIGGLVFAALSWWQARGAKKEAREAKLEGRHLRALLSSHREDATPDV